MSIASRSRLLLLATALGAVAALATAAEPDIVYPAKVTTLNSRIYQIANLGHDLQAGSFVFYDGQEEGRVAWRDLDKITFIGNIGHSPGSDGPKMPHTRRVRLTYLDGTERTVNLVVGHLSGNDGVSVRRLDPDDLATVDFDQTRIAPALYKVCPRGHAWEQKEYRFCPYDGDALTDVPMATGPRK